MKNAQSGILQDCCEVVLVFSNNPDARGLQIARDLGVHTAWMSHKGKQREEFDREIVELLKPYRLDYIVLAGYMRIITPVLIEPYRNRILNIHPADTAQYQGAHGYEWAFEQKLERTKITVHYIDEGVDTGNVLEQREVDLRGAETLDDIAQRGLNVEHAFYSQVLRKVCTEEIQ